jgi:hypothetical protein
MNKKPPEPVTKPAPELDRYMPGDPIPVPHAVEADTESAWALFSDTARADEPDFVDTEPASALQEHSVSTPPKNQNRS